MKNYVINSLKNYKMCQTELDMMENCAEYQYKNSLNIFSLTLGPFEREAKGVQQISVGQDLEDKDPKNQLDNLDDLDTQAGDEEEEKKEQTEIKQEESEDNEFVYKINERKAIKLTIYKLQGNGSIDQVWDLHEYLEYNKEKTSGFIKNIER